MSFFHYQQLTQISLEIYVLCYTQFGETLKICGNCNQLGNWNPDKGYVLKTDKDTYPQWKTEMPIRIRKSRGYGNTNNSNSNNTNNNNNNNNPPQRLQFKLCIMTPNTPSPFYRWQMSIPNRVICLQSPMILQFRFDDQKILIIHKKVTDIQCRVGTYDIIHDMQSSQTSSIQFKANYPVEHFYDGDVVDSAQKRKYSGSQMSSNLISQQEIVRFQQEMEELEIYDYNNKNNMNNINIDINNSQLSESFSVMRFKTVQLLSSQSKTNQHFHNNNMNNLHSSHHFQLDSHNRNGKNKISKSKSGEKSDKSSIGTSHHNGHNGVKNNSKQKDLGIYIMKMPDLKQNHVKFVSEMQKSNTNDNEKNQDSREIQNALIDNIKQNNQTSTIQQEFSMDPVSISSDQLQLTEDKSSHVEFGSKDNVNHENIDNKESVLVEP